MDNIKDHALVEWAKKQHKWQQHALHSIAKYGSVELIPEDVKERIKTILIEEAKGERSSFTPISEFDISDTNGRFPKTYLKSLGPVSNIDKLTSEQEPFEFVSPIGMTVIFGNNGSGKSGYARILKNLCRSHGANESLRGDATSSKQKDWEVNLKYAEMGEKENIKSIIWTKSGESKAKNSIEYKPLERIVFFDSKVANIYVDDSRDLYYYPSELRMYAELADLANELKKEFDKKIENLMARIPDLPRTNEGTISHVFISKLKKQEISELTETQLNLICTFSKEEEQELNNLRYKKSQTPEQKKAAIQEAKKILTPLNESVKISANALSSLFLRELLADYTSYQNAKLAAGQGVAELAKNMPISNGIGSDAWFEMFRAARIFAGEIYPGAIPPPIATGDRCVTCHQKLDKEAKNRLEKFDAFMDKRLQKTADETRETYEKKRDVVLSIRNLDLNSDVIAQQLKQYADIDKVAKKQIASIISDVEIITARFRLVKKIIEDARFDNLQTLINKEFRLESDISYLITAVEDEESRLDSLIAKHEDGLSIDEQNKLFDLEDKEKCFNQKNSIEKHFNLAKKINMLNKCKLLLATNKITSQSSRRVNKIFSNDLEQNYLREIEEIKLDHLNISVGSRGVKGELKVKINIEGLQKMVRKSQILSEGEQRAVALAGFLTEVNETDAGHAIVFDDPVSSLDWNRRGFIAKRLAEEAKKRQVIIFTHDFSFALQLKKHCEDNNGASRKEYFKQLWIGTKVDETGTALKFGVTGETVASWEYKNVKARLCEIEKKINELEKTKRISDGRGTSEFDQRASDIAKKLRQTWERAVEEIAFYRTIERFSPEVKTRQLKCVQFDCSKDYPDLHKGMSIASELAHDNPKHSGCASPTLKQLKENKKLLDNWVQKLKDRRRRCCKSLIDC